MQDQDLQDAGDNSGGPAPGSDPYSQIRAIYQQVTGGKYTPTDADVSQWGTNIDASYYDKIKSAIGNWWTQYQAQQPAPTAPQTGATETPTAPPPTPNPGPGPAPAPAPATNFNQAYTVQNGAAPAFTPPAYTPPPAFSYADFVAPTGDELNSDLLYKLNLNAEQDAIQKSAAARGVLNTGGTIYDLLTNARDVASSAYGSLFGRKLNTYQTNRQNAVENYNTNYGTQYTDPYKYNYQGSQDAYNSSIHNYDLAKSYGWANNLFDFSKDQDAFDRKYRLLSFA
jgi:hypothetical protein